MPNSVADGGTLVDNNVQSSIVSGMSLAAAQLNTAMVGGFNQLAVGASSMWQIALTSPTQNFALALQTASERGAGRTRLEANRPAESGVMSPTG